MIKIVNFWPAETFTLPQEYEIIDQSQDLSFKSSLIIVQTVLKKRISGVQLFTITRGTQIVPTEDLNHEG